MIVAMVYVLKAFHLALLGLSALSEISLHIVFSDFRISCTGSVARWTAFYAVSSDISGKTGGLY